MLLSRLSLDKILVIKIILVFGGCGRLLHALTPPRSAFLYLQFLARCHPYILLQIFEVAMSLYPCMITGLSAPIIINFLSHHYHMSSSRTAPVVAGDPDSQFRFPEGMSPPIQSASSPDLLTKASPEDHTATVPSPSSTAK